MRMFLFNQETVYAVDQISNRTGATHRIVDKELDLLEKAGLIRRKPFLKSARDEKGHKRRGHGWTIDKNFRYLRPFENLLIRQDLLAESEIIKRLSRVGKPKLVLIAGLFIEDPESRVDLLFVCDRIRKKALIETIKSFEAEIGKELKYAAFEVPEFEYRVKMYDKLIRDIFDYPHRKILDKLGLEYRKP